MIKTSTLILFLSAMVFTTILKANTLSEGGPIDFNGPWYKKEESDEENFKRLVEALKRVPTGKKILEKASLKASFQGMTLFDVVALGPGSYTDTTLVRRFSAANPAQVAYETRSKVYLNQRLKMLDALLDFSHELTHYTFREPFNPYDARFHLEDFIKGTVEGRGGEVEAYLVECQVLKEFLGEKAFIHSHCQKVFDDKASAFSKELGAQEFYKVGAHFEDWKKELAKFTGESVDRNYPRASKEEALFISSAWGLPYPVAAVKEYVNIMERVCKNDQNRLSLMRNKIDRAPASASFQEKAQDAKNLQAMFEDFKVRCEKFSPNNLSS